MKTDEIRKAYLDFFRSKDHEIVPSDSLVPKDDPSLLFTGAGMNQFKEKFLGRGVTYSRATTCQKCLRTGDLDNVGRTAGHHTFFEMLGNFSFGDYFKKEAIVWAWEFLTKALGINPEKLWASVYKDDDEAYDVWKTVVKIPEKKIVRLGEKENFWPSEAPTKGPNGPCGPCSEIFYDWGESAGCRKSSCSPACDCNRFSEIWNLVFTQFDRQPDGSLKPLPSKNIDTGMGLERMAAVMQGVRTNFEIDIFKPIVKAIESYIRQKTSDAKNTKYDLRFTTYEMNAIADHVRAVVFAISDGVMPSNEQRGYVVRKLIRRTFLHGSDLGIETPFLYKLVSVVSGVMGGAYPELKSRRDDIAQVMKREEENFLFVLDTELPKVEEAFAKIRKSGSATVPAETAFNFYDTYGMPYEMLEEIAERFDMKIDKGAFEKLLDEQRAKSRSKSKIRSEIFTATFAKKVEALGLKTEFLGHEELSLEANVLAILDGGEVILDKTPFYGESGGQAGDWGEIETRSGRMKVQDAKKIGDAIVHIGRLENGRIVKGETARASVNEEVRKKVMRNHTATHLLHAALRKVLGEHVHQTGSLVDSEHLRFDFTHMKKLDAREVSRVEEMVNGDIAHAIPVNTKISSLDAAKADGAMALFDEKYADKVRVVTIGDMSKELCGGTHVGNTKEIGIFKITSESSIASGVRRIEALTGDAASTWMAAQEKIRGQKLKLEVEKEKAKEALDNTLKAAIDNIGATMAKAKEISGIKVISEKVDGANMDVLRKFADKVKAKSASAIVLVAAKNDEKISFVISVTDDIVKKGIVSASDLTKAIAKDIGGSGGGRPDFAQGGGKGAYDDVVLKLGEIVKERLK